MPQSHAELPPAPLPPYKRALAAVSNFRLGFSYSRISDGVSHTYPGVTSSVLSVAGAPFSKPYSDIAWEDAQLHSGSRESLGFFIEHFSSSKSVPNAIVFSGGEPLMQANALLHLTRLLKASFPSCRLKIDTTGYYAEAIPELGRTADYLSLEVLAPLSPQAYTEATNFAHSPDVLYSAVEKSFAFLERAQCFKEVRVPVGPGLNDCVDCAATIAEETSFADLLVLHAVQPRAGEMWSPESLLDFARKIAPHSNHLAIESLGMRKRLR